MKGLIIKTHLQQISDCYTGMKQTKDYDRKVIKMKTVLCYGDSNTYGYNPRTGFRYPEDIRWTGRLSKILGSDYRVIEEGCNGRTTVFDDPVEGWKNGLDYLKPCLNSHKPVDIVVMMLGSNDLKETFHASSDQIAEGAGVLVSTIREFTELKQGFIPEIILVSPPEIGAGIRNSTFCRSFLENAVERSKELGAKYRAVAARYGCRFLNAAEHIQPSDADSLHLDPEAHEILAEKIAEIVKSNERR